MYVNVLPADMKTVKVIKRKTKNGYSASITLPPELVKRYNLDNREDEEIVIAYICRPDQDCKVKDN